MLVIKKLLTTRVGQIATILVGAVLVVILISYTLITYGQRSQQEKIEALRNEQQIQTRQRIDRAIRDNRSDDPDVNSEWLRQRNERQR